jgi:putative thioredoxin
MSGVSASFQMGSDPVPAQGREAVIDVTMQSFGRDVVEASRETVVLVDFWAPWCGPCKQLTPVLEKVVRAAGGRVVLAKMNIDEHPQVAGQLGIQSIPAVVAFKDGRPVDAFMGALPEGQVKQFVEKVAGPVGPSAAEQLLEVADTALAAEDFEGAGQAYSGVLATEPENVKAIGGLTRALVGLGDLERAREALALALPASVNDPAIAGARAQLELAEQAADLGDVGEFERRLAADPADHAARFELALALNARGERKAAAEQLVEIVGRDRTWDDDGARKQLLQFFDAWGGADPATLHGRRRLSAVLFR